MTREDIINQVLRNTSIEESEDYMEDYPYSRPSGQMSGFNVPLASTVGGVAAQSFGGHGMGGGFPMLPNFGGISEFPSDGDFAAENAAEMAAELATAAEMAGAAELANANANAARNAQEMSEQLKRQYVYDSPLEKPQAQTQSASDLFARGQQAVEEMREKGQVLRGERLTKEQMESAQEVTPMQYGRFADGAIEEQVRARNPQANALEIKAKAEEIKEKVRNSAETVKESDFEITYKDVRQPNVSGVKEVGTFGRVTTGANSVGRNFEVSKEAQRETEKPKNPTPSQTQPNLLQRVWDFVSRPDAAQQLTIGALATSNFDTISHALPANNVIQFPTAAKASAPLSQAAGAFSGDIIDQMSKLALPIDTRGISDVVKASKTTAQPKTITQWNPTTRTVNTVTPVQVQTPTIKTAAEKVASALKNITTPKTTTSTQKLTTKEKRLGKL